MAVIRINMTMLQEKVKTLNNSFAELEAATKAARDAGNNAVTAAGGTGTGAGRAVYSAIKHISDKQLGDARERLDEMIANLSKAATEYSEKNTELIKSINAIANSN